MDSIYGSLESSLRQAMQQASAGRTLTPEQQKVLDLAPQRLSAVMRSELSWARLLPMRQLSRRIDEIPTDPARPVLLICNTQNRSSATLRALRERGYAHVRYVNGGMSEWARRGWPMVKPRP